MPLALHTVLAHTELVTIGGAAVTGFVSEFLILDPHKLLQPLHGHADLLIGREVATTTTLGKSLGISEGAAMLQFHQVLIIFHYGRRGQEILASTNLSDCVSASEHAPLCALPASHLHHLVVNVCGPERAREILIYDCVPDDL